MTDDFRVYVYKQGYLRTSSGKFSLSDQSKFVHLTNHCFQVNGDQYAKFEQGNTLSYADFQKYLDETMPTQKLKLEEFLFPRIKDLIIDTVLSVKRRMNPSGKHNVFELFGFDFLLDEDLRCWLLECNTNPYLGTPNEYMEKLVPQMLNDMLKIVLDPVLPPQVVPDAFRQNEFELVFRDASKHGCAINQRRPFAREFIYPLNNNQSVPETANSDSKVKLNQMTTLQLQRASKNGNLTLSRTSLPALRHKNRQASNTASTNLPMSPKNKRLGNRIAGSLGSAPPEFVPPVVSRRSINNNTVFNTVEKNRIASPGRPTPDQSDQIARQILSTGQLKKITTMNDRGSDTMVRRSQNMSVSIPPYAR